jgi:signal transduction histidine kinase
MESIRQLQQRLRQSRWFPRVAMTVSLLILAAVIAAGTWQLRQKTRAQMLSRDADILHGVAQMVQLTKEAAQELGGEPERLPDQFAVALQISELNQLNGVIATRVFDRSGRFAAALPGHVSALNLNGPELLQLRALTPVSRFLPEADLRSLFLPGTTAMAAADRVAPLVEILIPLHRQKDPVLVGAVQFVIDGRRLATEFAALDRNLLTQAAMAFVAGGGIIVVTLAWAFRRLQRSNRLLIERTDRLVRANQELALAAKTSAVGAIAAHLVHGLSSPLSGLQDLVASRAAEDGVEPEWHDLLANAQQMRALIGEVVRVLGEEQGADRYEISLAELAELLESKVRRVATERGVHFQVRLLAQGRLANREANLVLLILENLLKNALQATPPGREVRLEAAAANGGVEFQVVDGGSGVPADRQARLFQPCQSTKKGGHGIGLAISFQLARHLGATLELMRSTPEGSVFALRLPPAYRGQTVLDPERVVR